jgi:hypothetical protein
VTPQQVQVARIELANKAPRGGLVEHGKRLHRDTAAVLKMRPGTVPASSW